MNICTKEMHQFTILRTRKRGIVIDNWIFWHHQGVVNHIATYVQQRNTCQLQSSDGETHLAIDGYDPMLEYRIIWRLRKHEAVDGSVQSGYQTVPHMIGSRLATGRITRLQTARVSKRRGQIAKIVPHNPATMVPTLFVVGQEEFLLASTALAPISNTVTIEVLLHIVQLLAQRWRIRQKVIEAVYVR